MKKHTQLYETCLFTSEPENDLYEIISDFYKDIPVFDGFVYNYHLEYLLETFLKNYYE